MSYFHRPLSSDTHKMIIVESPSTQRLESQSRRPYFLKELKSLPCISLPKDHPSKFNYSELWGTGPTLNIYILNKPPSPIKRKVQSSIIKIRVSIKASMMEPHRQEKKSNKSSTGTLDLYTHTHTYKPRAFLLQIIQIKVKLYNRTLPLETPTMPKRDYQHECQLLGEPILENLSNLAKALR